MNSLVNQVNYKLQIDHQNLTIDIDFFGSWQKFSDYEKVSLFLEFLSSKKFIKFKKLTISVRSNFFWGEPFIYLLLAIEKLTFETQFNVPNEILLRLKKEKTKPLQANFKLKKKPNLVEKLSFLVAKFILIFEFIGEVIISFYKFISFRAKFLKKDLINLILEIGPKSLLLISFISFLTGMILAFIGYVQLEQFGAQIFIASLVALGMAREMASLMSAIIIAGKSGASYTAQISSMKVNEEIKALDSMGISIVEFLVIPRIIAVCIMLPILTLYSQFFGILGGAITSFYSADIEFFEFFMQIKRTVSINHFYVGIAKSFIFAIAIATFATFIGINSKATTEDVGKSTTLSVVYTISAIIVLDVLCTFLLTLIKI